MKCPIDTDTDLQMSERQGVEIDYCPKCRGVWLDRGEIDKIVERSATEPSPESDDYRNRSQGGHYSEGYDPRKRRKGWLGDLFD